MKFYAEDTKLDFDDVLIVPATSTVASRKDVYLQAAIFGKHSTTPIIGVPVIAANMDGVGTFSMARALARHKMHTAIVKTADFETQWLPFLAREENRYALDYTWMSVGMDVADLLKAEKIYAHMPSNVPLKIMIDVANGYMVKLHEMVRGYRRRFPNAFIVAGNVVTPDAVEYLIKECGADMVKVGIGSGAVCTTRAVTGVGYPQLSAIAECAAAGPIIADGGCRQEGDFAKAFAAGASMVMSGSYFAGHTESEQSFDTKGRMTFYGMSSNTAQEKHGKEMAEYRASEGRTVEIQWRGPVDRTAERLLGGLRSTCAYVGASALDNLPYRARFIRVNNQLNRSLETQTIRV